jgi:hypothetical protein
MEKHIPQHTGRALDKTCSGILPTIGKESAALTKGTVVDPAARRAKDRLGWRNDSKFINI